MASKKYPQNFHNQKDIHFSENPKNIEIQVLNQKKKQQPWSPKLDSRVHESVGWAFKSCHRLLRRVLRRTTTGWAFGCSQKLKKKKQTHKPTHVSTGYCDGTAVKSVVLLLLFFLVGECIEDPNVTINGPSSARQRNAISMTFRWRADDGPILNAGLIALWFSGDPDQYCLETLYFCDI